LILSHVRPDGDAVGAMVALSRLCRAAGGKPTLVLYDNPPKRYGPLLADEPIRHGLTGVADGEHDGLLIVDTCSWQQIEPAAAFVRTSPLPRVIVDHHKTGDSLTGEAGATAEYAVDESASATCLLVHEWARAMRWLDGAGRNAAEAIFVGIVSDTGWLRFSNTDCRTLTATGELVAAGVRPDAWYSALYEAATAARVRLEGRMLANLRVSDDGLVAWSTLTSAMFAESGAERSDTEDIIQGLQRVAGVAVSVLFAEEPDGRIRTSLRSKSPEVCGRDIDVAAIAQRFGGGGHARAAGLRLEATLHQAQERVLAAVYDAVSSARFR
jgi:phosphoesterase RecJ-like protein